MEEKTCCVTGHRSIPSDQTDAVRQDLERAVHQAIAGGYTAFISGFADGVDLMFAEIVSRAMQDNPKIKLIAAIPYRKRLETLQKRERTKALIEQCAEIYVAAEEYQPTMFIITSSSIPPCWTAPANFVISGVRPGLSAG